MVSLVTDQWLWLPVNRNSSQIKLHFLDDRGSKFQEIDIRLAKEETQYYTAMDLSRYIGKSIIIKSALPDSDLTCLRFCSERPASLYPYRPLIHYSPDIGWMNDPNGLIFADGVYHLYHQWNPYGTNWGNMYWGHATSHDLISWKHQPAAIEPDEYGTVFSGSGYQDHANSAGFGKDALLFFYTAAGRFNQWSKDAGNELFAQHLAVSLDKGQTLEKKGVILDHIKGDNRDPKVFFHPESNAYIMILFIDGFEFAIFRSKDLLHWEESQRFSVEHMRECPDLFRLDVINSSGESKWVFWSADSLYQVGEFDGYRFYPETDVHFGYHTNIAYAAQTFSGLKGKTISIAWVRTENEQGETHGMMSLPTELHLMKQGNDYIICFKPVLDLWNYFTESNDFNNDGGVINIPARNNPLIATITAKVNGNQKLCIGDTAIEVPCDSSALTVILDHGILEYFSNNGLVYGTVELKQASLTNELRFPNSQMIDSIKVFRFRQK